MVNEINPESLPQVQSDEFLPSISPWTTLGGGILVVSFSAAVALASVLNYNVTVKVPATIRPAGELRIAQAATEGIVKSIEVKENQVVSKGEAIAFIDDSQLQTKKLQLQGNIQQNQLQQAQIAAQLNSLDAQIDAETRLTERAVAAAEAELRLQQQDHQEKQLVAQAEVQAAVASLDLAQEEMKRYQQLANTGAIAQLQVKTKEQAFKVAQAKLKQAQASLNPSDATVAIATERIAQEKARGLATLATLKKERENLQSTQIEAQNALSRDTKDLQQIGIELSKTFILAPTDGTILKLELRNTGQVVGVGGAIAQIAPSNAPLLVKARVAAQDIDRVKPGQQVQMQVSACPYPEYGTLKGTVTTVSADALPMASDGAAMSASPAAYEVTIQPQTRFVGDGDRQCQLQAGMEGRADIISRSETVLQFILRKARLLTDL
ncbi:HlyD family efflux transporter periplasmic adaptor subunit [Chroococcidiopsis sp. CCMEE 29]|uniref:HlyD family secretion protein n=1 Tax=Chroococcidiopsis sp. CCMEE 29 TaxID=155894 RepID=UPI0020200891|nr:HlyD family efflux transporter periplasmic adaptor subunit [Chroococcidiopsis sp. CCMEE 29]